MSRQDEVSVSFCVQECVLMRCSTRHFCDRPGAELPAFMTPQADLLKNMKSFGGDDEGAAKAAE